MWMVVKDLSAFHVHGMYGHTCSATLGGCKIVSVAASTAQDVPADAVILPVAYPYAFGPLLLCAVKAWRRCFSTLGRHGLADFTIQ